MRRRDFLTTVAAAAVAGVEVRLGAQAQAPPVQPRVQRKGRIKQSLFRQVFGNANQSFDDQCRIAAELGCKGFDLIQPQDWPTLKKYGLIPTMGPTGGVTIPDGTIRKELHESLEKSVRANIDVCAAAGCPNMITVGGQRRGMSEAEGADNCVAFLNRVKAQAEDKGVTICMEYLNSKVNHKDYMFDHVAWGVDVMSRVN